MNHIPKTKVHQGPIYWKQTPLQIVPKWHLLFPIKKLDITSLPAQDYIPSCVLP